MDWFTLALIGVSVLAGVALGISPLLWCLRRYSILDHPNERSSHDRPTPKGAGIVLIPTVVFAWIALSWLKFPGPSLSDTLLISMLALVLATLSWIDDLKGLPAMFRLPIHIMVALLATQLLPDSPAIFNGFLNPYFEEALIVLIWVWFINLFNFMDGIDGISAVETITVSLGLVSMGLILPELANMVPFSLVLLSAAVGFVFWNWSPARIFLGDVGSAPLGFLLCWQLLLLAKSGQWGAALILPGYYLADATLTLIKRGARGEKVWLPHREHFYQRASIGGASHQRVSFVVLISGLILAGLAILSSVGYPVFSLALTGVLIAGVLLYFSSRHPRAGL
ncbi:MAG: glycosyltransferase family 4 protein [Rhodospirillales bacterium]|nr:glycosyltransferase family 4 protein [Rhodospirillales bacterium]